MNSTDRRSPSPDMELYELSAWYDIFESPEDNILNWFTPMVAHDICQEVFEFAKERRMPCENVQNHSQKFFSQIKMAINISDKKALVNQILGQADITVTTSGITVSGPRLSTTRFIPFEECGRCRACKATEVEVDTMVTKEGITLWCSRISKPQFVPFDVVYDLPGHCFFRVKNKARVFNVPYGDLPSDTCITTTTTFSTQETQTDQDLKRKAKVALDLVEAGLMADAMQDGVRWKKAKTAINVLGNLLLAESLDTKVKNSPVEEENVQEEPRREDEQNKENLGDIDKTLDEFFDSIKALTANM